MPGFDPSEPAILHDRLTDTTQTWTGENAADFRRNSRTLADGGIAWRGFEFDGWGNVLGGWLHMCYARLLALQDGIFRSLVLK
jgi:hypothetical protein